MRVLFTSPILEHPAAGGPQLRVENSIKALSQVVELDIISRSAPSLSGGLSGLDFFRDYCTELHITPTAGKYSPNRYVRKLQSLLGQATGRALDSDVAFLVDHIKRRQINVIWCGYGNISFPLIRRLKKHLPDVKVVCDTDSVWSRFILRELPLARWPRSWRIALSGARKEAEERAWVNLCEVTTAVSETDAEYYRSIAKDPSRVCVFSNVIDTATYDVLPPEPLGYRHPSIYLAGTFGHYHSPMDIAARWMLEEVLPIVRRDLQDVHFYIVGANSDRMFGHIQDPHVTVTGRLPTVLPYLVNCDVSVVPLKFESGTRFKILEAGACGVPIVSTTLGAEGLNVADREHLLIADTPEAFAAAVVRTISDKAQAKQMAGRCAALVRDRYSIDRLVKESRPILEKLSK